jgi:hypothetical protein
MADIYTLEELPKDKTTKKITPKTIKASKIVDKIEDEILKETSTEKRIMLVRKILKERIEPTLPSFEERCKARVYTTKPKGYEGQCKKKKMGEFDFCKFHEEQNRECP